MDLEFESQWREPQADTVAPAPAQGGPRGRLSGKLHEELDLVSLQLLRVLFDQVVRHGSLTIIVPGDEIRVGSGTPAVTIRLHDRAVIRRILSNPDLAVGEAYMDGLLTVENGGIYDFIELCLANRGGAYSDWVNRARHLVRAVGRRLQQHNPVNVARNNVAHHYDLGDALYESFLDADMQYSCAFFANPATDTLEQAQQRKKRHLAAKLLLQPGQRVLDIGCGWGGLALSLARWEDVDVTGVTLSTEQIATANRRARDAGLAERVHFELEDYRRVRGRFQRIVSVGMFEHVGVNHYGEFFEAISRGLTDDGVALLHTIGSADGPSAAHPWINKYIFPGGYAPALSEVLPIIERSGLYVTDIEVWRLHYAYTLQHWRERFMRHWDRIAGLYDERFCRMWEFYLAGCEATFRHSGQVVFQIQLAKRLDAVPLTRDYIEKWERKQRLR